MCIRDRPYLDRDFGLDNDGDTERSRSVHVWYISTTKLLLPYQLSLFHNQFGYSRQFWCLLYLHWESVTLDLNFSVNVVVRWAIVFYVSRFSMIFHSFVYLISFLISVYIVCSPGTPNLETTCQSLFITEYIISNNVQQNSWGFYQVGYSIACFIL